MTKTELLETIRNGENSGVEFKRDDIEPRELAKELVSFANLEGGCVVLGVENDGRISGLTRSTQQAEEWVMNIARDKVRPKIIPYFEVIKDAERGKDVAMARVERGWSVHHVWHNNHRTYYIRVGTESREASHDELERLFQQRGAFRLKIRPVSGSSLIDFDKRRLRDYFSRLNHQEIPVEPESEESQPAWRTLLVNTEFLSDESGDFPCTVAGLLLFGKNPNRFLPQAGIDAVAYPGKEKDYASVERAPLRGPMVGLFGRKESGVELLERGLIEQALEFVRRNAGVTAALVDGSRREERLAYPEEAIREGIVNAVVHRDYLLSATNIELSLYSDRLEIISPGRLPNGITPARMLVGCRAARNQLLKDVMRDYRYLEHMGMGVPRKIEKCMQEHNRTTPDLIEDGERFILRLWKEKKP